MRNQETKLTKSRIEIKTRKRVEKRKRDLEEAMRTRNKTKKIEIKKTRRWRKGKDSSRRRCD